ncbi:MAG: prenyltransferase, partial [Acidimicrobiia bacterium]|nr:prenyltransferase [Acidimicrobiia bacterium]
MRSQIVIPDIPGVLSANELSVTADHLVALQLPCGMIPWFPGGHCDPWNHVESAMALDVAGRPGPARAAYEWLAATQDADGSWPNYVWSDGSVEEPKRDTNVCAYLATGLAHHWRRTGDAAFVEALWPAVTRALSFVLSHRRADGLVLWAV